MARKKNDISELKDPLEGRGRTPIGKQVNVRIPPEMLAAVEFIAKDGEMDNSTVIRMVLAHHIYDYVEQVKQRQVKKNHRPNEGDDK